MLFNILIIKYLYLQKTSESCNVISVFKAYKQCVTKPKVTTSSDLYRILNTHFGKSMNLARIKVMSMMICL